MKGLLITLGVLGAISALPVFRGAGHSRHDGVSFWRLLHDSVHLQEGSPFGHEHLTIEEATRRAQEAYQEALRESGA